MKKTIFSLIAILSLMVANAQCVPNVSIVKHFNTNMTVSDTITNNTSCFEWVFHTIDNSKDTINAGQSIVKRYALNTHDYTIDTLMVATPLIPFSQPTQIIVKYSLCNSDYTVSDTVVVGNSATFVNKTNTTIYHNSPTVYQYYLNYGDGSIDTLNYSDFLSSQSVSHVYTSVGTFKTSLNVHLSLINSNIFDTAYRTVVVIDTVHSVDTTHVGITNISNTNIKIFSYGKSITVNSDNEITQISVISLMGQVIETVKPNTKGQIYIDVSNLIKDIYFVAVTDDIGRITTRKLLLQ